MLPTECTAMMMNHVAESSVDVVMTAVRFRGGEPWRCGEEQSTLEGPGSRKRPCATGNPFPGVAGQGSSFLLLSLHDKSLS
jgi:hypothetical protein